MLYYSHINEDNRVEKELLNSSACTSVVAVAGSGERVLALLDNDNCKIFHVVDVNEEALFLLQLKLAALENLYIEDFYQFTGHRVCNKEKRLNWFNTIKNKLTEPCKMYWVKNISFVENGVLNTGHFEKFLTRVRPTVNYFLGNKFQTILTGMPAQSKDFPSLRWNLLKVLYSFRWIYSLWGNRDIAFISKDADIYHIPNALDEVIKRNESASCFMMHLIFKGHLNDMKEKDLPPSLQKNVLHSVKQRLINGSIKIQYHHTDLLSFIKTEKVELQQQVFYSVSDLLSFENNEYLQEVLSNTDGKANIIVWRTFLRNRLCNPKQANDNLYLDLSEKESTRMYQVFAVKESIE